MALQLALERGRRHAQVTAARSSARAGTSADVAVSAGERALPPPGSGEVLTRELADDLSPGATPGSSWWSYPAGWPYREGERRPGSQTAWMSAVSHAGKAPTAQHKAVNGRGRVGYGLRSA